MPKKLGKSLKVYLSKLKRIPSHPPSTSSLLSACKYPKTPSFALGRRHAAEPVGPAATLSDVDRFLQENFHSLYLDDVDDVSTATAATDVIKPSARFFVSPSRTSSSLVATSSSSSSNDDLLAVPATSVAVVTLSHDPYNDFRRSMKVMVESKQNVSANLKNNQEESSTNALDWDFMEELLFCYLELNDRSVHKYILKAFTDLTVSFRRRRNIPKDIPAERSRRRKVYKDLQAPSHREGSTRE